MRVIEHNLSALFVAGWSICSLTCMLMQLCQWTLWCVENDFEIYISICAFISSSISVHIFKSVAFTY